MKQLFRLESLFCNGDVVLYASDNILTYSIKRHIEFTRVCDANFSSPLRAFLQAMQVALIVFRKRPSYIVTTGASVGGFACFWGKLLGCRVCWIDSLANTTRLSLSGRICRLFADVCLTQWPELAEMDSRISYEGSVF